MIIFNSARALLPACKFTPSILHVCMYINIYPGLLCAENNGAIEQGRGRGRETGKSQEE
jgi:hypothetical protein